MANPLPVQQLEQALGIPLSTTPPPGQLNAGSYVIDGVTYWPQVSQQQQEVGGPGLTGAQQSLLASISDPYLNEQSKQSAYGQYANGALDRYNLGGAAGGVTASSLASANGAPVPAAGGTAAGGTAAGGTAPGGVTGAQKDAGAYLNDVLSQYGLGSLKDFAWNEIVNGRTSAEVLNDIRQTQQFKDRFPAIAQREQYNLTHPGANLPPISPGEYVSYEKSYQQTLRNAGLPQGFMDDPSTVTKLIANDVSIAEMTQRIDQARVATYEMNPEALSRLQQMHGIGPGSGALTALMLDPTQAEPLLKRDLLAAQIGGQADRTGYLGLNNTTAQVMAQNGVSEQQAQSGFTNLQHDQPLFGALPGTQESNISQSAQLAAQFDGNAEDQRLIDARRSQRISQFADGGAGGFAGSASGMSGLGSAPR